MFGLGLIEIIVLVAVLASLGLAVLLVVILVARGTQRSGEARRPMISHTPALVESDGVLRVEMPLGPDWADRWVRVVVEPGDRV